MRLWKNLLASAYRVATKSNDPSTQNGAIIIGHYPNFSIDDYNYLGSGYNRFPDGVLETPERWNDRAQKYKLVQHAERAAIETALRTNGVGHLDGATMVCGWAACSECAKAIIGVGIKRLVTHKQAHERSHTNPTWREDIAIANMMLREAGVEIIEYDGTVNGPPVRHSGTTWNP